MGVNSRPGAASRNTEPDREEAVDGMRSSLHKICCCERLDAVNHLVVVHIVGDEGNLIVKRADRDPGVCRLDWPAFQSGAPQTSAHLRRTETYPVRQA
jgi:hypothetical protein